MTNFIWQQNPFKDVPAFLITRVESFRESAEFEKLDDFELEIAGVVCGAFAEYLCKIHERKLASQYDDVLNKAISSAKQAIEVLASSPHSAIRELVTDEIFENLRCKPEVLENIKNNLEARSLELFHVAGITHPKGQGFDCDADS